MMYSVAVLPIVISTYLYDNLLCQIQVHYVN